MSDYERAAADLAMSIRLGYEAEQDDPNFHFDVLDVPRFDGQV